MTSPEHHGVWNLQIQPYWPDQYRRDFVTGYSDGFYAAKYGSGLVEPTAAYLNGYNAGMADRKGEK